MRVEYTNDEKRRLGELIAAIKALDTRDADFYAQHPYPDELDGEPVSFTVPADDNENATFWQQHAQLREIWEQTAPAGWWEEHLLRERKNAEDGLALQKRMDDIKHKAKDRAYNHQRPHKQKNHNNAQTYIFVTQRPGCIEYTSK